ncbi:MAG: HigA family addiction module antidote protein [Ferrovum sp.]|nr:HigA family addiction module antidote protein [Ferrovum sp.]
MLNSIIPQHPGETLRDHVLPVLGLNVTQAASQLGVTRAALSRVLNGRAAISPEMALRLEKWLKKVRGVRADLLIAEQASYDLWQARRRFKPKVKVANILKLAA